MIPSAKPQEPADIYSPEGIKSVLARLRYAPQKKLGQNFLIDPELLEYLISAARIQPDDLILEIGPGLGQLTRLLAHTGASVQSVELDKILFGFNETYFKGDRRVSIQLEDGVHFLEQLAASQPEPHHQYKLVANLPYQITSPVLFAIMKLADRLPEAVITIQRDMAERITAQPGNSERSVITVLLELNHTIEILRTIPAAAFWPQPKVESAVVRIKRFDESLLGDLDPQGFSAMVRHCFQKKRKMMKNALAGKPPLPNSQQEAADFLVQAGIEPTLRPEKLSVKAYVKLWQVISLRERAMP